MLPSDHNPEQDPQEQARQALNQLRLGTIAQVDHASARVRFQSGEILTDWLPWLEQRSGGTAGGRTWRPPVVGEQGMLLAAGGDLGRAVVLPGVFSDGMPAGASTPGTVREDFNATDFWQHKDGEYELTTAEKLTLTVGSSTLVMTPDSIELNAGGASVKLSGGVVKIDDDAIIGGISFKAHVHGGVLPGPMTTTQPVGAGA